MRFLQNKHVYEAIRVGLYDRGVDGMWKKFRGHCYASSCHRHTHYKRCGYQLLMQSLGINAIRLRVWVNPAGG